MALKFNARTSTIELDSTSTLTLPASTTSAASLNIAEGVAPTVPADGDVWVTAAGEFFARLNGVSTDLAAGGGGNVSNTGTPLNNQIAVWTDATTVEGSSDITWNGTIFTVGGNASFSKTTINELSIVEQAAADVDVASEGQIWVRDDAPNTLMYTDDAGNDFTANNVHEIEYEYSSAVTSTDPGAGVLNFNSVTIGSIATLYIDDVDNTGRDNSYLLSNLADGDILSIRSASDPADYIVASINGAPTDSTGFWTIGLTLIHTGTIFTNTDPVRITVEWASQAGGTGTVTSSGTPLNNEVAVFTSGTDIDSDSTFTWDGTILTANSIATTATNALSIASTQPRISMEETGLGADLGAWIWNANGGDIALSTATDATPFTPVTDAMKFTRGATTAVTGVAFEGTVTATTFSGSGASLTSLVAANISSGNLGSGVVPYITASGANTNFQIAFANTAAFASGNFGLLIDNTTAGFTYNPTNNSMDINGTQYETGGVFPSGSYLIKGTGGGNTFIDCNAGSSVDLYYNGILSVRAGGTGVGTLDIVDGDTAGDASSKQIFFRDSALAQKALITSSTDFTIANNVNGGLVVITAEDSVGTARTILSGDPDGQTILRADNGLSLQVAAGEVAILGDSNGSVWLYNDNVTAFRTVLQTATDQISGAEVRDAEGNFKPVGIGVVINDATTFDTVATHTPFQQANATQTVYFVGAGAGTANFDTYTNVEASQTNIPAGTMWYVQNNAATTVCLIRGGASVTIRYWAGTGAPADVDVTVARGGVATIRKVSDSIYDVWGVGLS